MAAKYTDDELQAMVKAGHAMKNADGDPSYPIKDEDDLEKAIKAVGRGGADHDAIRKHVMKRAKALGLSSKIPDNWAADGSLKGATTAPRLLDPGFALRKRRRGSMIRKVERRGLPMEMRAKPDGTGGTTFEFEGYGSVFNEAFPMWDNWGEQYREVVMPGAFKRSLATPGLYVPFLIGHNDRSIPLAQTCNGTMHLSEDSHGLHVLAQMDGRRTDVQNLAYAVERGDMDQMSIGFVTMGQEWSPDFEQRSMLDLELDGGDVSSVAIAASRATAGSTMTALPTEALRQARPGAVRMPTQPYEAHPGEVNECPQCHSVNDDTAACCDQCGNRMKPAGMVSNMAGVEDMIQACPCGQWNSADAKYCGQCGQSLAGSTGGFYSAMRPGERRAQDEIVDMSGAPDYNPVPHEYDPGALQCKNADCTVPGGAKNSGDAKYCDQCGQNMYAGNGVEVVDDSGVVEDIEGAAMSDAELLAHRSRKLELLALTG